jgi:hypothetical protein
MRPLVRQGVVFLVGLVVGSVAASAFVAWHWKQDFRNWYVQGVADQAFTAREIYAGRGSKLADRVRGQLPTFVLAAERNGGGESRDGAYWLVSDVYQVSGTPVPDDIKPIIERLPPRPSCKAPRSQMNSHEVVP